MDGPTLRYYGIYRRLGQADWKPGDLTFQAFSGKDQGGTNFQNQQILNSINKTSIASNDFSLFEIQQMISGHNKENIFNN